MSTQTLLSHQADKALATLSERHPHCLDGLDEKAQARLRRGLACSDFLLAQLLRHPQWLAPLLADSAETLMAGPWQPELGELRSEAEAMAALRQWRNRKLAALALLGALGEIAEEARLRCLSALAEGLIVAARDWLYIQQCALRGTPCDEDGNAVPLLVLGMGKLGGGELNFSSDIDLIFVYPRSGETRGGRREMDNHEFFVRLGQKLIALLDAVTEDGFVYRVDMRLRPFGDSGPLVLSFSALEDYYQSQGREWERYAMVKGRLMGGGAGYGEELEQLLRPFVYRRYLDYSAINSLRDMKRLIEAEVRRRGLKDNIKLGPGGIREVEFLVQVFQLIRGGREPALRTPSLLAVLALLPKLGVMTEEETVQLRDSYLFLRSAENNLQAIADEQTQTLPESPLDRARLAAMQGFPGYSDFLAALAGHQAFVHRLFRELISEEENEDELPQALRSLALADWSEEELAGLLAEVGLAPALAPGLFALRQQLGRKPMGERGRKQLDKLLPQLLLALQDEPEPQRTLARLGRLLEQVASRTVYLELLLENPGARRQLVRLMGASAFIAERLTQMPILLDELIDPRHLYSPPPLDAYEGELRRFLLRIEPDDVEGQMEALRQFKAAQTLRIAAADVTGVLPLMKVSDHLTCLAETLLATCLPLAWQDVARRHGQPPGLDPYHTGLLVVAYGKLGGLELGYSSDLDLVFLTDLDEEQANALTDGQRAITVREFYLKLVQRLTHWLATRTLGGVLYEIDMRLRPSGASGLLVTTLASFEQYQQQEAWLWEHQALVRARAVLGDEALRQRFASIRLGALCQAREGQQLKEEVRAMRDKMRLHLDKSGNGRFDLKQGRGGITDIEFLVQYWLLASHQPGLLTFSDNIRQLDALAEAEVITPDQAETLKQAYIGLRQQLHRQSLDDGGNLVADDAFKAERAAVSTLWDAVLG
ncbi:bifunctional [glutamate--ammonia ligase]-adenylyl-L-tyrosine phosphorylase/[glutamate--ammonia-ligase] adenylyltransferase [Gallaecimonas kandeliae]|uniref:bifunctional [glutamate--ammonia ligase]-adenylyl-L-tyrosine phosphorylase/[glutamate--ammonia-ligase] adenylyltransferase n=1 Tax=Gallaecimonas kandeliae TaxID=3029055 RepID=UPI002647FEDF|nr:bifunctional [glutamate--ammonia ligase]-adenylyl-L-tyrosine phosphorylase/[glutamate--ammonia-ligase] adenylyltransferase [Gallaecimonas kandeliae]WKE64749.1 bifunctional [glutamate--ammonia ligase]-adenylyl-L-tyrosine phosphorylase/[glutamate--ammonia-ligase] adenylyltransferase [Gallaecimonas kandeliae]